MNNFNYTDLPPFKWFVLENFPYIEADFDAITNWQLFCKLGEEINKIIEKMNIAGQQTEDLTKAFNELKNYINNYFENLDVQNEINNKLDEMAEDGTLKNILDELLVYEKLGKKDNQQMYMLGMKRIMRTLERNSLNPNHIAGEDYAIMQGGTYVGNNKMVIARIRRNDLNDTLLQEISLDTGRVIRETKLQLAHANSITFDPTNNKLYVSSLILNINGTNTSLHEIYVINYIDFTLENTIVLDSLELTEGIHSVSYDIVTNKFYVATENTRLGNAITLYEMNLETYEITKINLPDFTGLLSKTDNNDILVYNNIFYLLKYQPQVIISYDLEKLELRNIYNINSVSNEGYTLGELENISIKFDSDLKNIIISSNHFETLNGWFNNFQYFECNPVYNICENIPLLTNTPYSKTVIVDINSESINPDGSNNNAFKHIGEALELAQIIKGSLNILIKNGEYPPFTIYGNSCNINISRHSSVENINDVIIDGIHVENSNAYIYIFELAINNIDNNFSNYYNQYDLYIDLTNKIRLANIHFISDKALYHIYARRSTIEFVNLTYINTLFITYTNPNLICLDSIATYNYYDKGTPNINKPIRVVPNTVISNNKVEVDISKYKDIIFNKGTWIIEFHGFYSYKKIYIPVNTADSGTRITSIEVYSKLIELIIENNKVNNKISFKIDKAIDLKTLTPIDITSSITGDMFLSFIPVENY